MNWLHIRGGIKYRGFPQRGLMMTWKYRDILNVGMTLRLSFRNIDMKHEKAISGKSISYRRLDKVVLMSAEAYRWRGDSLAWLFHMVVTLSSDETRHHHRKIRASHKYLWQSITREHRRAFLESITVAEEETGSLIMLLITGNSDICGCMRWSS